MNKKTEKELWLFNNTNNDVLIGDLGVKVLANSSVNIYAYNPYISEDKVKESIENGSLLKRLSGEKPVLRIVKKKVSNGKDLVNKIKQSNKSISVTKNKSSVVIDQKIGEEITDDSGFDFADFGIDKEIMSNVKIADGVVISQPKETEEETKIELMPIKPSEYGKLNQSSSVMQKQKESEVDAFGKIAPVKNPPNSSSVVVEKENNK